MSPDTFDLVMTLAGSVLLVVLAWLWDGWHR